MAPHCHRAESRAWLGPPRPGPGPAPPPPRALPRPPLALPPPPSPGQGPEWGRGHLERTGQQLPEDLVAAVAEEAVGVDAVLLAVQPQLDLAGRVLGGAGRLEGELRGGAAQVHGPQRAPLRPEPAAGPAVLRGGAGSAEPAGRAPAPLGAPLTPRGSGGWGALTHLDEVLQQVVGRHPAKHALVLA